MGSRVDLNDFLCSLNVPTLPLRLPASRNTDEKSGAEVGAIHNWPQQHSQARSLAQQARGGQQSTDPATQKVPKEGTGCYCRAHWSP